MNRKTAYTALIMSVILNGILLLGLRALFEEEITISTASTVGILSILSGVLSAYATEDE